MRSRLADGEIWRQRGEMLSVVVTEEDESELTRLRLDDAEV
jgi:hypothetical protein